MQALQLPRLPRAHFDPGDPAHGSRSRRAGGAPRHPSRDPHPGAGERLPAARGRGDRPHPRRQHQHRRSGALGGLDAALPLIARFAAGAPRDPAMPAFQYKAIDRIGRPARGKLDAGNEVGLELTPKRSGLDCITVRTMPAGGAGFAKGSVTRRDLITFCFDLEQISRSGIPLIEGLRDLRGGMENPRFREILSSVLEDIEGGKMLSQGLAAFPQVFTPVFVSLIRAGEQTGRLVEVFENLGKALKWQDELVSQTRKLLLYPSFVLVVVLGVVIFLLTYLVPQVVTLLKTMGLQLPLQTRILIALSNFVVHYWYVLLLLPVLVTAGVVATLRTNAKARYYFDYLKLRLP